MSKGIVYLIGAGPGDPGLMTVKGRDCLHRAEVVVYDYLSNPVFLDDAPAAAERIYVGKSKGRHHAPQDEINALLVEKARAGKVVVRLKGGDPYVFGRGGEEAQYLHRHKIPFEVVPGITAAFAAAAYAGIPLTHRDYTTSLGLVTGHEDPAKKMSSLDWEKLATGVGTLVFYMGMANLRVIAEQLMAHGRAPETPVAIIRWATTPRQETVVATLADVVVKASEAKIKPPAVILVGEVVNLRDELRWFDNRPLFGKRVMVTRAAAQAGEFAALLTALGAEAVCCPTIETVAPADWTDLDVAIAGLPRTDYLILTSANAVRFFFARLTELGQGVRALAGVKIVAVGPKTAGAIEERGIYADLMPSDYRAEGVVELLTEKGVKGSRVLYPKANLARDLIPSKLRAAGALVSDPVAYRTIVPEGDGVRIRAMLAAGEIDVVTFASSSAIDNFIKMVGDDAPHLLDRVAVASIGPLTSKTALRQGISVAVEPEQATVDDMLAALIAYYQTRQT
ncbi:MAG: uroporphyrinogen-III C-methyltransferase [Desulfuromonadaceae bacterium]|nr:uroporphyrinogen-III C-methyltransferase [Desulfuromonadaceae bacterium]